MKKRKYVRRKKIRGSWANLPDFSDYRDPVLPACSNGFGNGQTPDKSVMRNLHKESLAIQEKIKQKATQMAPVCNEGAYMYIGESDDITALGRKK